MPSPPVKWTASASSFASSVVMGALLRLGFHRTDRRDRLDHAGQTIDLDLYQPNG